MSAELTETLRTYALAYGMALGGALFLMPAPSAHSDIINSPKLADELKEVSLGSLLPPNQIRLLEATFLSNEVVSPAPEPGQGRGRKAAEGRLGDRLDVGKELNRAGQWAPGCPDLPVLPAQNSVQELMARALELESQRWAQDVAPQRLDGHCHSELAIDIIQVA